MSSSDAIRRAAADSASNPSDRAALIEQLLLAGLDQYFSGDYEQAIHVWTRVFFLDRGHARARAYIERARGALAERQREAEAQGLDDSATAGLGLGANGTGVTAVSRVVTVSSRTTGEPATARALVPRRFSRRDLLLGGSDIVIDDGVDSEVSAPGTFRAESKDVQADVPGGTRLLTHVVLVTLATVLLCGAAYVVLDRDRVATWWRMASDPGAQPPALPPEPLPIPRASEQALVQARQLFEQGKPREAMQTLAAIRVDDPLRHDADGLLADIERALLAKAGLTQAPPSPLNASPQSPLLSR